MSQDQGANERLLSAARSDNEELLLEVFEEPETFDINFRDGLGNTALHYAAQHGSVNVLEHILSYEGCDVDFQNRLEHDTPLHLAIKNLEPELRNEVAESLLEAGSNTKLKDKHGDVPADLLSSSSKSLDDELRKAIRKAEAEASVLQTDIANDDEDDDEDGSESGSDDE